MLRNLYTVIDQKVMSFGRHRGVLLIGGPLANCCLFNWGDKILEAISVFVIVMGFDGLIIDCCGLCGL